MTYPSHCCQKCGLEIGWVARLAEFVARRSLHHCEEPDRIFVDREGVSYLPRRDVRLQAKGVRE